MPVHFATLMTTADQLVKPDPAADENAQKEVANPLLWVPTSYFAMGTVYVMVTTASVMMFKNLGLGNAEAAFYSSLTGFAYSFKFMWAPLLELYRTKKFYVIITQLLLAGVMAGISFLIKLPNFLYPVVTLLMLGAISGATMDIVSDGVYLTSLDKKRQAVYAGVQGMCWSIGPIIATGVLFMLVGWLAGEQEGQPKPGPDAYSTAWLYVFLGLGILVGLLAFWHITFLPPGSKSENAPKSVSDAAATFGKSFVMFFQKPNVLNLLAFAFFYRFGLGLLDKIGPLFLEDAREVGGLGLNMSKLGAVNGLGGTAAFIVGGLLGGVVVSRLGLKRTTLLMLVIALNVPNVTFLYLGLVRPESIYLIGLIVIIEKLGWGFGAVGHMIYMMQQLAPGPYKTAHYAFGTGLGLSLCMTLTGMVSGFIQEAVGYQWFFVIVLVAGVPSILAVIFAPFRELTDAAWEEEANRRWENMDGAFALGLASTLGTAFIAYFLVLIPMQSLGDNPVAAFATSAWGALGGGTLGLLLTLALVKKYPEIKKGSLVGFAGLVVLVFGIRLLTTGGV
ncbi:MAG: MFS transporter [Polyangiaceae bacterium]|nr:MFS transporter [Polyangiaceae bacterium]